MDDRSLAAQHCRYRSVYREGATLTAVTELGSKQKRFLFPCFRAVSCEFVDRDIRAQSAIHEITRTSRNAEFFSSHTRWRKDEPIDRALTPQVSRFGVSIIGAV